METNNEEKIGHIYSAISMVMKDIAKKGIAKNGQNTFDKYQFRKIDDVYNSLSPIFCHQKVFLSTHVADEIKCTSSTSAKGGVLFNKSGLFDIKLTSCVDGSSLQTTVFAEGSDRLDKASSKMLSNAVKIGLSVLLCIPFESVDIEEDSGEIVKKQEEDFKKIKDNEILIDKSIELMSSSSDMVQLGDNFKKQIKFFRDNNFNDHDIRRIIDAKDSLKKSFIDNESGR